MGYSGCLTATEVQFLAFFSVLYVRALPNFRVGDFPILHQILTNLLIKMSTSISEDARSFKL